MTNQEIKDRAPDGATHYFILNGCDYCFCKIVKMQLHTLDKESGIWYPLHGSVNIKPL